MRAPSIQRNRFFRHGPALLFILVVLTGGSTQATELRGSLSYNGQPVSATFPGMSHGQIFAYNRETHQRTEGPVDPKTNAYSLNLPEGSYNIQVVAGDGASADSGAEIPGNLVTWATDVAVGSSGQMTLDLVLYYMVHVVSPFDNDDHGPGWGGSLFECPFGAEVSPYFHLEWEPVPGVDRYEVRVQQYACPDPTTMETIETTQTSVEISIDPSEPHTFYVSIQGFGAGPNVVTMPQLYYDYENGTAASTTHWLHTLAGTGRPIHSEDSSFVLQLAHVHGVGSSFWTTDLILSNSKSYAVTATLTFTPRNADGLADYTQKTSTVPAFGCRTLKDVLGNVFGLGSAVGSLEISPSTIHAYTRTATPGSEGSFGQFFPAVRVGGGSWASLAGGETIRAAGVIRGASRTNLALAEVWGEAATIQVKLTNRDGSELGAKHYDLTPFGNIQLNDVVKTLTGDSSLQLDDAQVQVQVTAGDGRVGGALSVVAAGSNDPITVMLE